MNCSRDTACTTDYDLPLTWVVTNGVVKCTEAEDGWIGAVADVTALRI
ncbi:MAG: hypothetical protein IPF59_13935 [Ignavibacteria bacterium]|nr:hypothetical protein [Ignavibacteria bacterium]